MGNLLLSTDSYKHSHFKQYPEGTQYVSSYIEARGDKHKGSPILFFGIQAFIEEYLANPITADDIFEAKKILKMHGLPFNEEGWTHILREHGGYLPLSIQALPEGTLVDLSVPVVQVRNTDPKVPWLTSFIETALLRAIWYATSVATMSFAAKTVILHAMNISCDNLDGLPFKLHDFGARGVSSGESAGIGGMAHLVNFSGTDTLEGIMKVREVYSDGDAYMPGFSIPASEHSTMTAWGRDGESKAYSNMIDQFGSGLLSIVADSYDLGNAVEAIFGEELKSKIEAVEGKVIIRPDSGDPVATPLAVLEILWDKFGGTVNTKGYRVLHPKVAVIQGDGMNFQTINELAHGILDHGFSMDNIAFGMGGGLLQSVTRNDFNFAMKANAIDIGDGWTDIQKKPATDPTKASKAGRQAVVLNDGVLEAIREDELEKLNTSPDQPQIKNQLIEVWGENGYETPSFDSVRKRAHQEAVDLINQMKADVETALQEATEAAE